MTGENPTSNVIETSSGARFEIHDDYTDSGARVALRSRGASDKASYVRLGKADTTSAGDSGTLEDHYAQSAVTVSEGEGVDGIALYTADSIREAAKADKITEVQGTIRVEAHENIVGRSVQRHLLRGRRMVIVSGTAQDEPAGGETIDAAGESLQLEDDDMMLSSKRNLYISAHGDIHETTPHSVITEVGGDEIARTSGIPFRTTTEIRAGTSGAGRTPSYWGPKPVFGSGMPHLACWADGCACGDLSADGCISEPPTTCGRSSSFCKLRCR